MTAETTQTITATTITTRTTTTTTTTTSTTTSTFPEQEVTEFYVYRSQNDEEYVLENINAANIAGELYYLHHEVVRWRPCALHHGITRIMRLKVTMKVPT